jgi:methionyl-tRNA formyltransferase
VTTVSVRIVLFGMTGFGNSALRAIRASRADIVALVTRRETGKFPYYPERDLIEEAREARIDVYDGVDLKSDGAVGLLTKLRADFLLGSSFHQKIAPSIIQLAPRGAVNIHPSLLPAYRGPTPTSWCLAMGEKETGVTAHYLTQEFDGGPIVTQRRIPIHAEDTNGSLRFKLASLAQELIEELIEKLMRGKDLVSVPQNDQAMSHYPRWTRGNAFIDFNERAVDVYNRIRASIPYPGPYALYKGKEVTIKGARIMSNGSTEFVPGQVFGRQGGFLHIKTKEGAVSIQTDPFLEPDVDTVVLGQ